MNEEIEGYGPAMRALTEKQQRYVLAMLADPFGNATQWARAAGYSDKSEGAKVAAFHNAHNPLIEAAANEVARQYLGTMGPVLGVAVAMRIARDAKHPKQLRAAEMLLNRVGLHEKTEHHVVTHGGGGDILQRITDAASLLGVDPAALLGANTPVPMKVIEGTVEVEG
jgi:phage terminase small subunit